jgi:hypothetical protein
MGKELKTRCHVLDKTLRRTTSGVDKRERMWCMMCSGNWDIRSAASIEIVFILITENFGC